MKAILKYDLILPLKFVIMCASFISSISHDIIDKFILHIMDYSHFDGHYLHPPSSTSHTSSNSLTFLDIITIIEKFNKSMNQVEQHLDMMENNFETLKTMLQKFTHIFHGVFY